MHVYFVCGYESAVWLWKKEGGAGITTTYMYMYQSYVYSGTPLVYQHLNKFFAVLNTMFVY